MKILEQLIYRGPNLYAHFPVIRMNLDLGELEQWPSATIPGFVDGLLEALPSLQQQLSYDIEKDFVPVTLVAYYPIILVVNPALPISMPVRNTRNPPTAT